MKLSKCIILLLIGSLFAITGCDIIKPGSESNEVEPIVIKSEKAVGISARAMLPAENGFFLLGTATRNYGQPDQMYLAKINQQGDIIWEQIFDDGRFRDPETMIKTSDGNILVTGLGWTSSTLDGNLYIGKISTQGNILWEDTYLFKYDNAGFGGNRGMSAVEVEDGYIIGGKGSSSSGASGSTTSMVTKVGFDGELRWTESLGEFRVEWINNLLHDTESGDLFAALNFANDQDIYRINPDSVIADESWSNGVAYLGDVTFGDIIQNQSNSYIAVGYEQGRLFQTAFSREGDILWNNYLNDFERQSAIEVIKSVESNFYTLGTVRDSTDNVDIYVINSFSDGTISWKRRYGDKDTRENPVDIVSLGHNKLGIVSNYRHDGFYEIRFWKIPSTANE